MDTLKSELKEAKRIFERAKREAYWGYVKRNALAGIGDVVSDGRGPVLVDDIGYGFILNGVPHITYSGKLLQLDLTPRTDCRTSSAVQGMGFEILRKRSLYNG